jgi:oligoendopeptidase F
VKSYKSRIAEEKRKEEQEQPEWDRATVASDKHRVVTAEDRVAQRIANEVLKDNQKLRGIHSNQSIKKILEKEAKRQLLLETNGVYNPPTMSRVVERGEVNRSDPSNLPYLHKCPAV